VIILHQVFGFRLEPSPSSFLARVESAIRQAMAVFHDQGKSIGSPKKADAYTGPVSVGRFVAPIAGKTLSRGGTVLAELTSEWATIAGSSLAGYTSPAKLTKAAAEPDSSGKPTPAVLHLKVDPAKALEVQYSAPQLIERINQTLGYRAVSGLRLVQAPVLRKAAAPSRSVKPAPAKNEQPMPENRLSAALARMARGVKARGCSS
jgi:hypothetical protein